jgi:hypothetical protein
MPSNRPPPRLMSFVCSVHADLLSTKAGVRALFTSHVLHRAGRRACQEPTTVTSSTESGISLSEKWVGMR